MGKLDSTRAFTSVWCGWKFIGIYPTKKHKTLYKIYAAFTWITIIIWAPLQLLMGAFVVKSFGHLMKNLATSIELTCCSLKIIIIFILRSNLLHSHDYLVKLDRRAEEDPVNEQHMKLVIRSCRRIASIFSILFWVTSGFYAVAGLLTRSLIFDTWWPYDYTTSTKQYTIAFTYQTFNCCYQAVMNVTSDTYSVLYSYVLLGHMRCLARNISSIGFDGGVRTSEQNYKELIRCVNDHRNTLGYFNAISPVISGTIFIQFLVTAFVLCMTAICALIYTQNVAVLIKLVFYLLSVMGEVLPCCYLVNQVMVESSNLTTAIYSCNWMDQDIKFRKAVIIFMQRSQMSNKIMAGKLFTISLVTFMSLVRISFSMFTLLSTL